MVYCNQWDGRRTHEPKSKTPSSDPTRLYNFGGKGVGYRMGAQGYTHIFFFSLFSLAIGQLPRSSRRRLCIHLHLSSLVCSPAASEHKNIYAHYKTAVSLYCQHDRPRYPTEEMTQRRMPGILIYTLLRSAPPPTTACSMLLARPCLPPLVLSAAPPLCVVLCCVPVACFFVVVLRFVLFCLMAFRQSTVRPRLSRDGVMFVSCLVMCHFPSRGLPVVIFRALSVFFVLVCHTADNYFSPVLAVICDLVSEMIWCCADDERRIVSRK